MLIDDIINAAIDETFIDAEKLPRSREAFAASLADNRQALVGTANALCDALGQVLERYRQIARRVEGTISLSWVEAVSDIRDQISQLIYPGFVSATGLSRLKRLAVYLQAMDRRLDSIDQAPDKDRRRRAELLPVWESFKALPTTRDDQLAYTAAWQHLRWDFEELRISLFAQDLGTLGKVSVSRLENRVRDLKCWNP
jgi:ATP-dependent helicase HrpA